MLALYVVLALLICFFAFVIIRTLNFKPNSQKTVSNEVIDFDKDRAVECLRELIRCKTVSYTDSSLEDDNEFDKFKALLPKLYPNVFKVCEYKELPDRALLFKWKGETDNNPAVFMAHYDVVPVVCENWEKDPFGAEFENGVIWGRGTLDTKTTFNAVLYAAEELIQKGFTPERDFYFAFSGGEEVNGKGAVNIVDWFSENGITPEFVLDEGGAVVENVFPGVKKPCGLIGIAEKGMMNVEYKVKSNGGHASSPKPDSPIELLSKACLAVIKNPFKYHLSEPVAKMFDTLGRNSNFLYRMIFANLWLFMPILNLICVKSGGELNALVRTTTAFTMMQGSDAPNVIPPVASIVSNMRLNPYDNIDSALKYLKDTVNNDNVEINLIGGMNPSRISVTDCLGYEYISNALASTWKGTIVSPYLMVACSDSRHYGRISDKVYRFSAMDLTSEERASIHGNNEKIRVETLYRSVEFYLRLMKMC